MRERAIQVLSFMTRKDESEFSRVIKQHVKRLVLIDEAIWQALPPPTMQSLEECSGGLAVLLNEELLGFDEYCRKFIKHHPSGKGFLGGQVGRGLIQFIRSRESKDAPGCLKDGRLAATYDPTDVPMKAYVDEIWRAFKRGAKRVYA